TVTVLAVSLRGGRSAWYLLVAWAALLGVNNRSGQYFSENRPDMPALMFGALGLLGIGRGQERRRGLPVAFGSACLVVGFFFKQTICVFAAVPLVALILRGWRPIRSEVLLALVPLAVTGGAVLALKVLSPTVYHYMVEVPGAYKIDYPLAVKCAWEFLAESPLFLVLIGEWIVRDGGSLRKDPRVRWLMAILAV